MKTFKTEKHNIPEGATHYLDESDEWNFLWLKSCPKSGWRKCSSSGDLGPIWVEDDLIDRIKPIPQTKEVEWNGEGLPPVGEVVYGRFINPSHTDGEWLIHYISKDVGVYSIAGYECQYTFATESVLLSKIRCEDSEQELESAYELYSVCSESSGLDYDDFIAGVHATELNQWLSVVRKTGYRLEKCK